MELIGVNKKTMEKDLGKKGYVVTFLMSIILAFVLSQFIHSSLVRSIAKGMEVGIWVWIVLSRQRHSLITCSPEED